MEGLGINLGYLLVQIFNFLIIFVILRAVAYRPMINLLDRRRKTIAQSLEDARVAAEARANAEREAEAIISEAQQKATQHMREASDRAEQTAREIKAVAEQEAAQIRETASVEAEQTKTQALDELRSQIATLSIAAAQKVVGEVLDTKRQRELIAEFFSGVRKGKVVLLEDETLAGAHAEVTSALPLTKKEQDIVKREVLSKLGGSATVSFRVDERILGGLVIRVGDKVLDGSVAGKFERLRQSLE
ncbi:MAG: F0F1 ATP synthase subunit B [Anaerolineales bacterium]|nr:F0F1 ATP synthase subunit B [Anaerolineales bacterium]